MKVEGCVTRLVIFTVVIIMSVLALIVPAVLEDYWFEADMQRNMEDIAVALDNPFCREALLPIGLIGVLFNSVALAFGVRLRRKRGRKERAMQLPAFSARYTRALRGVSASRGLRGEGEGSVPTANGSARL